MPLRLDVKVSGSGSALRGGRPPVPGAICSNRIHVLFVVGFNWSGNGGHELETSRSVAFYCEYGYTAVQSPLPSA